MSENYNYARVANHVQNSAAATHQIDLQNMYGGMFPQYNSLEAVQINDKEDFRRYLIIDEDFIDERLRVADKHIRDYRELPDKGQFPFTKQDGNEAVYHGYISFHGSVDDQEEKSVERLEN